MKTKHYIISGPFAATKNIPTSVVATPLVETPKALYLYGRGEIDPEGTCCKCGRRLTHPGSILLGIGPECLGSWEARDIRLSQITEDDKQYMRALIRSRKIDCWLPKSVIKDEFETDEIINPPKDHPMLNGKKSKSDVARAATKVKFQNSGKPAIKITFPFNVDDLNKVKTLPGRRFHDEGKSKYWSCPLTVEAVEALQGWEFEMGPDLTEFLEHTKISLTDLSDDFHIEGLQKELFPFQKKGVAFIEAKDGRALIADSMGLGKTAQALAWLQMHPEKRPVIVVVPASLKLNWDRECQMWMSESNVQILSGKKVSTPIIGEIIIINYDILPAWYGRLSQIKAQVLIIDEAHFCKNNSAKRTKTVKALAKNIPHIIALTGTPIVNRPVEAYNAIAMIDSTVVPNFWTYAQRYCGAKHNGYGWDFSGATRTEELHEKLTTTIMLRRLKKDVLTDLPDKIHSFLPIELNNSREYQKAEKDFIAWLREKRGDDVADRASNAAALAEIEGLKQLACKGKLNQAIEWIRDAVETNGKLVIFAVHKFVIDALMNEFGEIAVKVDGSVTGPNREKVVQDFQTNENIRVFVGNIKAAGVGLTLTASSTVMFLELPWSPGDLSQAEDRCHRIGQKNSVAIYYLLAERTIEEKIARMLDRKRKVLDSVLDGKETEQESLLSELINAYREGN
jgi:SWI/SNF-related matrix-associated actin-dependent regulator of chromatin subfamily A-like protein 1